MRRLALVLFILCSAPALFAQTGFPLYGSFQSGQSDSVNLQNLNTNFQIPLVNTPGRNNNFGLSLAYNSLMWSPSVYGWIPGVPGATPNGGWMTTNPIGTLTWLETGTSGNCGRCYAGGDCDGYTETDSYNTFVYVDPAGTPHSFGSVHANSTYNSCTDSTTYSQTLTGTSADGLYYINLSANPPSTILVYSRSGMKVDFTYPQTPIATDRNGNYFQSTFVSSEWDWIDTSGRTALRVIPSSGNWEYHYTDPSGTDQKFTLKYQNYSMMTNFGCSGMAEYNSSGTMPQVSLPYELDLPNGKSYSISYEATPSHSGYVTGRVSQITLPTGGSYQYQYTGSNDGINCSDGTITNLTRIVSDGSTSNTWAYARTSISGAAGTTTVTAPTLPYDSVGNQSVYTFNSSGKQTQEVDYQGSSTALRTVNTTWATNGSPATQVTILPTTLQTEVDTTYDSYGDLTQMKEYDWGSGATGSLLRETDISYSTISATFAFLVPSQKLVKDGSGTVKYREDYAYDGSTPTCVTGTVQHDDTNYGCSYNTRGNMTSLTMYTDPATPSGGVTKSFTYDVFGNLLTAQLNCCQLKTFAYTSTTNYAYPDSVVSGSSSPTLTVSATYNSYTGQIATSTDENGQTTSYSYDSLKRPTSVTRPDSVSLTTSYDDTGLTVTQNTPIDGSSTLKVVTAYDGLGRPITAATKDGSSTTYSIVQTTYDSVGRAYRTSNPYTSSPAYWTESRFDGLGRPLTTILPDTTQSTVSYSGNCSTATDPASKSRKSCSDGSGRMTKVYEDPSSANYETDYTYNVLDALTQVSQGSQTRTYAYDGMGRLTSSTTPESGTFNFSYNSFNLLTQRTDARGVDTIYSYDSLNRPYQISYNVHSTGVSNPGTITYTYGTSSGSYNNGRITQMSDGSGSEGYTYDRLGEITQVQKVIGGTTYTTAYAYNEAGQLTQITYPSGRAVAQNYDAIGRLCSITAGGTTGCSPSTYYASGFGYTAAQQVSGFNYGNGVAASFGYSADRLQLTSLAYTKSSSTLFSLNYGYTSGQSNNGQITNISDSVDSGRTAGYSYDALARLSGASTSGSSGFPAWGLSFGYDRYGNRTAQTVTAGSAPSNSLSVDSTTNRLTNTGFSYDSNGNMTNDGVNTLVYDAENHLASINSSAATYTYDGNGLRVQKSSGGATTNYIFSGGKPIAEYASGAATTAPKSEYLYSGGQLLAEYRTTTSSGSGSAPSYVQSNSNYAGNVSSNSVTFSSNTTTGNLIVVFVADNVSSVPTVSDNKGNTYQTAVAPTLSNYGDYDAVYYAANVTGGSGHQITVNFGTANYNEVAIVEVSGAATSSPFDVSSFNSEAQVASDQPSSGAATTTANDIVLGYVNGVFNFGFTAGSGFTLDTTFNATYDIIEHQRQSSPGSISATATSSDAWRGWGDLMVAFKPGSTTTTTTALQYYHPDHLSPRVTTDSSGNVIGQQGHYPFGESWYAASTTTKYQFTSYERDSESGNDYAQARYHINRLGRFSSPDPLSGDIGDPQSFNRYAYVRNMPLNSTDPTGMFMVNCSFAENFSRETDKGESGPSGEDESSPDPYYISGCGGGIGGGGWGPDEVPGWLWPDIYTAPCQDVVLDGVNMGNTCDSQAESQANKVPDLGPGGGSFSGPLPNIGTLSTPPPPPVYCDPNVINAMTRAWNQSSNGTSGTEGAFRLDGNPAKYDIVPQPPTNQTGSAAIRIVPGTTFAVFHTHPNNSGPYPSTPDNNHEGNKFGDTGVGDKYNMQMYVVSSRGLTVYDPTTKQSSMLRNNLDWTKPCN
jgi:RHS repeat-associated protein